MIELELSTEFSCAHFYSQPLWTEKKNREIFGKCYSKYGHGHDYRLQVRIIIQIENLQKDEAQLQAALKKIQEDYDHKHLNFDFTEFTQRTPTTENISQSIAGKLKAIAPSLQFKNLKLFERPDLFVEFSL